MSSEGGIAKNINGIERRGNSILKRASESIVCTYRIIHNVQKEDAVNFSGENGIDTTEKLKELILKTSATSIPVKFVAYDYYRLMKNGSQIVSKEQLILKVWGYDSAAEDNNVEVYISFLRRKLEHLHSAVKIPSRNDSTGTRYRALCRHWPSNR